MQTQPVPQWFWLLLILLFAFITRLYRIEYPPKYVFDEVYHAVTAKLVSRNDPRAYEWFHGPPEPNTAIDWLHPPLAKYTQALSILAFGENSFGWRFSSVVFGVGVIGAVYVTAQLAFQKHQLSLLAALLASLDGLLLVQSRIAMNDIHVTFFILLSLIFYLLYKRKRSYVYMILAGCAGGLAMGSKWSGVFMVIALTIFEGIEVLKAVYKNAPPKQVIRKAIIIGISFFVIPFTLYVLSYSHMFLQGKTFDDFYKLHKQIWAYQTNLTATHDYQSRPLQWFFDVRPVWYYVDYLGEGVIANIYAFGNPLLFWFGGTAAIASYLYLLSKKLTKQYAKIDTYLFVILFCYGITWLPWILSPRIMFFYHYAPAVPFLSILLAFWLDKIWNLPGKHRLHWNQLAASVILILISATFVVWYPNWTALPVSQEFADKVYFMFKNWK